MRRSALALVVGAAVAALVTPAVAGPAVPVPTASATFDTYDGGMVGGPKGERMAQPAMTAAWTVAKTGRDATLKVSGTPVPAFPGYADAVWTSAPLKVTRRGTVAKLEISWSGAQLAPHSSVASSQVVSARFTNARGKWGVALPIFEGDLTTFADNGTHSAVVPVRYTGPVPMKALQVQILVADTFNYTPQITHTLRVKVV